MSAMETMLQSMIAKMIPDEAKEFFKPENISALGQKATDFIEAVKTSQAEQMTALRDIQQRLERLENDGRNGKRRTGSADRSGTGNFD